MNETDRKARNKERLTELYPVMARKVAAIIADMEGKGYRPRIQEAYRSPADQMTAYQTGHSKLRYGFHNVTGAHGKPEALAVDLLDDDAAVSPSTKYLLTLASSAASHGCTTGIRWGLAQSERNRIDAALAAKNLDAHILSGWDPCHVEITGATPAQAKANWRPT